MPDNINPYIELIRTARYGEQVRGAIADALEQTYADVDKPNVDIGLTVRGDAADAKETGDRIRSLESDLGDTNSTIGRVRTQVIGLDTYVANLVDVTNSVSGKAAEAKVTGDTLEDHIQKINALQDWKDSLVDVTLSTSGKAAEAKVTGDTLEEHAASIEALEAADDELKSTLNKIDGYYDINTPYTFTNGYYVNADNGLLVENVSNSYTEISVHAFRGGKLKGRTGLAPDSVIGLAFYDIVGNYISGAKSTNTGHYEFDYDLTIPENAFTVKITLRIASADLWINPTFDWKAFNENLQDVESEIALNKNVINKINNIYAPVLRNGTALNPGNANAVTTKNVIAIDRNYDYFYMRFAGAYNAEYKYGFNLTLFKGATDGLDTSNAVSSPSITKKYINQNLTVAYSEIYSVVPVIDLEGYDHISITAFVVDGNGDYVPLRIANEQYCIVCGHKYDDLLRSDENYRPQFTSGYYVKHTDGLLVADTNYSYAEIPVVLYCNGKMSGVTGASPNTPMGLAFYDIFGNYITGIGSTNTGNYVFAYNVDVPENAATVRITLRKASASLWKDPVFDIGIVSENIQDTIKSIDNADRIEINNSVLRKLVNARHISGNLDKCVTFLHLSDIHQDAAAFNRIMYDAGVFDLHVDDIICTGDMVSDQGKPITSWWPENVLTCVGNHDSAVYSGGSYNWTAVPMATRDEYYIAPFKSNWGITHTSGNSYYYKDYASQKVRLIVLDCMLYMGENTATEATAQTSWLANLLTDAITNSYHVLIAVHAPHGGATPIESSFTLRGQTTMPVQSDCNTPQTIIDTVSAAINNGLIFAGYIVGHTHQDNMWDAEGDGKQLMYCVTCAAVGTDAQWKNSDQYRSYKEDAYNLVTIDTHNTLVKIVRGGGANIDNIMRPRDAITFNYTTGQKVAEIL